MTGEQDSDEGSAGVRALRVRVGTGPALSLRGLVLVGRYVDVARECSAGMLELRGRGPEGAGGSFRGLSPG
jgi:hypothetical protein